MAKVSVIIPNYNHARFLAQRIDSILDQSYQDFEIIILDDCSTDDSANVIEKYRDYAKVSIIEYNVKNSGSPFPQWQRGIKLAKGKFIWIAESDDFAERNFLKKMVESFGANDKIGISFCNSNWVDENGDIGKSLSIYNEPFLRKGREEINLMLRKCTIQNVSATLIDAALAKKHCNNIAAFKCCGDWLFYIQILQESDLCYCAEILNNFRWYHSNTSNNALKTDAQIVEGVRILALLKPKDFKLSMGKLYSVSRVWIKKISQSSKMSEIQKVKSMIKLSGFIFRFVFAR